MAPLAGTGLLADELFLMVHDSVSGRPGPHPRTVGLGLAGALLGELALDRRIALGNDSGPLAVVDRTPPRDALAHTVLDQLLREPAAHPVRDWLSFLSHTATDGVAERLQRAGLVARDRPRRRWRGSRWVPTGWNLAAMPAARVRNRLLRNEALAVPDVLLVRLALAMGLGRDLLWDAPPHTGDYLDFAVSTMPAPLPELIRQTEVVITVASHRG
jgi:hypothetical protein